MSEFVVLRLLDNRSFSHSTLFLLKLRWFVFEKVHQSKQPSLQEPKTPLSFSDLMSGSSFSFETTSQSRNFYHFGRKDCNKVLVGHEEKWIGFGQSIAHNNKPSFVRWWKSQIVWKTNLNAASNNGDFCFVARTWFVSFSFSGIAGLCCNTRQLYWCSFTFVNLDHERFTALSSNIHSRNKNDKEVFKANVHFAALFFLHIFSSLLLPGLDSKNLYLPIAVHRSCVCPADEIITSVHKMQDKASIFVLYFSSNSAFF